MDRETVGKVRRFAARTLRNAEVGTDESFYMEMNADGELCIRGCRSIREYSPECILLAADECFITFEGTGLYFKSYSGASVVIAGSTEKISFVKRG